MVSSVILQNVERQRFSSVKRGPCEMFGWSSGGYLLEFRVLAPLESLGKRFILPVGSLAVVCVFLGRKFM